MIVTTSSLQRLVLRALNPWQSSDTTCKIREGSEVYSLKGGILLTKCFRVKSVKCFLITCRCGVAGTVNTAPTAPVMGLSPQALGVMGAECWGMPLPALAFLGCVIDKPVCPPVSNKGVRLCVSQSSAAAPVLRCPR